MADFTKEQLDSGRVAFEAAKEYLGQRQEKWGDQTENLQRSWAAAAEVVLHPKPVAAPKKP